MKRLITVGGILGFLAVAVGAFGAHGLEDRLTEEYMEIYQTGVHYHLAHTFAILFAALLADRLPERSGGRYALRAGWFFAAGILIFSGSLYILAISGIKILGAITPIGGVSFLIGWALLAAAGLRKS
jgi:uncharacterized membrane protein YgdD (TMEM256/DUF423 family)